MMKYYGLIIGCAFTIYACDSPKQQEESNIQISSSDTVHTTDDEDENAVALPSPAQIAVIYNKADLKYVDGITAQIPNDKTGGELEHALRLGIYSADLFYCLLNKQLEPTKNYFMKCREMSENIGMGSVFSPDIMKRMEKNIENKDSLINLLSVLQFETDNRLQTENKEHITYIAFTGGWIESIYIASKVLDKNPGNKNLPYLITEQILIGNTLLKALKQYQSKEPAIEKLITEVTRIMNAFNQLQSVQKYQQQDEESETISISEEELKTITSEINTVRQSFLKY